MPEGVTLPELSLPLLVLLWHDVHKHHEGHIMATVTPNLHGIDSMSIAHARASLSVVVGRARHAKSPTILTSRGKPVAAIVPMEDLELIEEAIDIRLAAEVRQGMKAGDAPIPWEDVKAALKLTGKRK